jgi:hypothetical protein
MIFSQLYEKHNSKVELAMKLENGLHCEGDPEIVRRRLATNCPIGYSLSRVLPLEECLLMDTAPIY